MRRILSGVVVAVLALAALQSMGAVSGADAASRVPVVAATAPSDPATVTKYPMPSVSATVATPPFPGESPYPWLKTIPNTIKATAVTRPVSPADLATNVGVTPTLSGELVGFKQYDTSAAAYAKMMLQYTVCPVSQKASPGKCGSNPASIISPWVQGSWTVPAGTLAANTTYRWVVSGSWDTSKTYSTTEFYEQEAWFSTGSTLAPFSNSDYSAWPATPSIQSVVSTLTPTLTMKPMHQAPGTYKYNFTLRACPDVDCTAPVQVATSGDLSSPSWVVPANVLNWNSYYTWDVNITRISGSPYDFSFLFNWAPAYSFATVVPTPAGSTLGLDGQSPRVASVNLNGRNFEKAATDAMLPSLGGQLSMDRRYSSANKAVGAFGLGWSSLLDVKLSDVSAGRLVRLADGHEVGFGKNRDGSWAPMPGSQGMSLANCASPCLGVFTDRSGNSLRFESAGLVSITTSDGHVTSVTRNASGQVTQLKDNDSGRSLNVTWSGAQVASVTPSGVPSGVSSTWKYTYDTNRLVQSCAPGATSLCTKYGWDATAGLLTSVTSPGGAVTDAVTYSSGAVTAMNTGTGNTTFAAATNTKGTLVTVTSPTGTVDKYQLDSGARPLTVTNSRGGVERWYYNEMGLLQVYQSAQTWWVQLQYTPQGQLKSRFTCAPGGCTIAGMLYGTSGGAKDRLVMVETMFPGYGTTLDGERKFAAYEYEYDAAGRIVTLKKGGTADGDTQSIERYTYSAGSEAAVGGGTTPAGLVKTVTDPLGSVTSFAYTSQGQLASKTDPRGLVTQYRYDWAGRLLSQEVVAQSGVEGQKTTFAWDASGRLLSKTLPPVTDAVTGKKFTRTQTAEYNADGFVTGLSDAVPEAQSTRKTTYGLDPFGRVLTVTGPDGVVQQRNTYDAFGRMTSTIDADNARTNLTYTPQGDVESRTLVGVSDASNTTPHDVLLEKATYDQGGRVRTRLDATGVTRRYDYAFDSLPLAITALVPQPDGSTKEQVEQQWRYDDDGQPQIVVDHGAMTWIEYDRFQRPTKFTTTVDGDNKPSSVRQITRTYDARGDIKTETVTAQTPIRTTSYDYDSMGDVIKMTVGATAADTAPVVTTYKRDAMGRVIEQSDPRSTSSTPMSTLTTWDTLNREVSSTSWTNAAGYKTTFGFDGFGRANAVKDPSGAVKAITFDANDRQVSAADWTASGGTPAVTSWTYTPAGKVATQTAPDSTVTAMSYDVLGDVVKQTRTKGSETRTATFGYDDAKRLVWQTDPSGATTTNMFDPLGNLTQQTVPTSAGAATTTFGYDANGNVTSSTSPLGVVTKATYNFVNEKTSDTDPAGITTAYVRDQAGRVVSQERSDGTKTWVNYDAQSDPIRQSVIDSASSTPLRSWNWSWDGAGNLVAQVDPLGGQRQFAYDQRGLLTKLTYEDGATAGYKYDAAGNATEFTDPNNNTTTATYTPTGLLAGMVEPATTGATDAASRTWAFEYDPAGRNTKINRPGGSQSVFTYNIDGKAVQEQGTTGSVTNTRTFGYDPNGRLTSYPTTGGTQTIAYDPSGNPTASAGPGGASTAAYDLDGHLTKLTSGGATQLDTYDTTGRLSTATISGATYTYAYAGERLASVQGPNSKEEFAYDLLGNMTQQKVSSGTNVLVQDAYTFDAAGNRTSLTTNRGPDPKLTYQYDYRNRLTGWTAGSKTHTVTWDPAGNLTGLDGDTRAYDARNRLRMIGQTALTYAPDGRRTSNGTDQYNYDAFGNLSGVGKKTYQYDGLGRLTNDTGTTLSYAFVGRTPTSIGATPQAQDPNGKSLAVGGATATGDAHGDIITTVTGSTPANRTYSPFGASDPATTDGKLGYQGDYTSSGLVNMDARWYDPATGTFLQRDNIPLNTDEQNRYAYANNNPIRYNDPTGHCAALAAPVCGGAGGAALGGVPGAIIGAAVGVGVLAGTIWAGQQILKDTGFSYDTFASKIPKITIPAKTGTDSATSTSATAMSLGSITPFSRLTTASTTTYTGGGVSGVSFDMPNISISIPTIHVTIPQIHINIPTFNFNFTAKVTYQPGTVADAATLSAYAGTATAEACAAGAASCTAYSGTASALCAAPGTNSTACAPTMVTGIWANEPAANIPGDATATNKHTTTGNIGNGLGGCPPGEISTTHGCEDPLTFLQRKADELRDRFANDRAARNEQLYRGERQAEADNGWLQPLNNGKAMERGLGTDAEVAEHFDWVGGPNNPDFVAKESGLFYELTTTNPATIASHLTRVYVNAERIITYAMWFFGG